MSDLLKDILAIAEKLPSEPVWAYREERKTLIKLTKEAIKTWNTRSKSVENEHMTTRVEQSDGI